MRAFLVLLTLVMVSGCFSLTPAGQRVKYVTKAEAPAECELVGEVDVGAGAAGFQQIPQNYSELKMAMRNKAAELGGNFLVIDAMDKDGKEGASGTGRAFRCPEEAAP